jgi:hypothetical protein
MGEKRNQGREGRRRKGRLKGRWDYGMRALERER